MKRILLFVMTNLAVVAVLGVVASLLGVNRYLTSNGLNLGMLLGFAALMGFGGAGPLHVNAVARLMGSWPAISPVSPGVLCALGDATTRMRTETARSFSRLASTTQADELIAAYAPWLALTVSDAEEGWILMTAQRPA